MISPKASFFKSEYRLYSSPPKVSISSSCILHLPKSRDRRIFFTVPYVPKKTAERRKTRTEQKEGEVSETKKKSKETKNHLPPSDSLSPTIPFPEHHKESPIPIHRAHSPSTSTRATTTTTNSTTRPHSLHLLPTHTQHSPLSLLHPRHYTPLSTHPPPPTRAPKQSSRAPAARLAIGACLRPDKEMSERGRLCCGSACGASCLSHISPGQVVGRG